MSRDTEFPRHITIMDDGPAALRDFACRIEQHDAESSPGFRSSNHSMAHVLPVIVIPDGLIGLPLDGRPADIPIVIVTSTRRREVVARAVTLASDAAGPAETSCDLHDLIGRLRAALSRQDGRHTAQPHAARRAGYLFSGWRLERRRRRLIDPDGCAVALTKSEFALLSAFLEAPRRTLTRAQLLQATRLHEDIFDRSIDVQVLRLRRKLQKSPADPRMIRTERGVGYVFESDVERY
jgi:two-component system, OmpR family, response regulator